MKQLTTEELHRLSHINSKKLPQTINLRGERYQWVGIGWVHEGPANGTEAATITEKD